MESPNYHYQPEIIEDDDAERWLNEGGHLSPTDDVLADEAELPIDQPTEPES